MGARRTKTKTPGALSNRAFGVRTELAYLRHLRSPFARVIRYEPNDFPRADRGRDGGGRSAARNYAYLRGGKHRIVGGAEGGIHGDLEIKL